MRKTIVKKKSLLYWLLVRIPVWLVVVSLALVFLFKWVPVRYTPFMLRRSIEGRTDTSYQVRKAWVPLEAISPELVKAVILSEDRNFAVHHGFDFGEMKKVWKAHREAGLPLRGCSTISQQTAKNVFTQGRWTWFRKAAETWWTLWIEGLWGKRRILEVYLNVVEMGKGVFGIEAASQAYFGIPAKELTREQAIRLATCLPVPLLTSPFDPPDAKRSRLQDWLRRTIPTVSFPDWVEQR